MSICALYSQFRKVEVVRMEESFPGVRTYVWCEWSDSHSNAAGNDRWQVFNQRTPMLVPSFYDKELGIDIPVQAMQYWVIWILNHLAQAQTRRNE